MTDIQINYISFKGKSSLNILSEICAICRENVTDKCIKCNNDITKKCYSILGICNHSYHYCCIKTWTNGLSSISQKCPLCNNKWEIKRRK